MALEKDKERPTSPNQRMGSQNRVMFSDNMSAASNSAMGTPSVHYRTQDQHDNLANSHNKPSYSESPMQIGRNNMGYSNKNMLLSPGGQLNNMNTAIRREDSMTSTMQPPLSKQGSEISQADRMNPIHRLSKASSLSSSSNFLQNTPHEETKSIPSSSVYSQNASPAPTGQYKALRKEAEGYHSQGYAARKKGDYKQAIEYYSKALEVLPSPECKAVITFE